MIVIDYVPDGASIWFLLRHSDSDSVPGTVLGDVEKAVALLHANGWVFGDLRDANVVVSGGRGFLVDFDWAGKEGEDRYPAALNENNSWHNGVCVHGGMRM